MNLLEEISNFLDKYEETDIKAIIQYDTTENHELVNQEAENLFNRIKNKFVNIGSMVGKFKKFENRDGYFFFKKRARNKCYHYSALELLISVCVN